MAVADLQSTIPPEPRVVAIPTRATELYLGRPVLLHRHSAKRVLQVVDGALFDANAERRAYIEAALERLADLRDRLVAKLDAMDADADLEPSLSALDGWDQRHRSDGPTDDREDDAGDLEPSLGSLDRIDQRAWACGGCSDLEYEHDGREPCCEDEGAQCDDEGIDADREPDCDETCHWQDEGDQTTLIPHRVFRLKRNSQCP